MIDHYMASSAAVSRTDRVRETLVELITELDEGDQIPSERELSQSLGVSRETLRRRIGELTAEGHLQRKQGSGTFVAVRKLTDQLWLSSFSEDMRLRGLHPSSRLVSTKQSTAGEVVGALLEVSPDEPIFVVRRVRHADGEPMAVEDLHVASALVPDLQTDELADSSFYELLEARYGIEVAHGLQTIEATVVDEEQAGLLKVPVHSAALFVERTSTAADGLVIEYVRSVYRGDRYRFEVASKRLPSPLPGLGKRPR